MWFVGESRWQVHGSTLLTDSAGASGRVHNNTQCLSPPLFLSCRNIPQTPKTYLQHTHTRFLFLISMCWCQEIAQGTIRHADIQLSTISLAISCFPLSSPLHSSPSLLFPCFSLSLSVYLLLCLCMHLFCLTSLHSLLLPLHSCTCPLTRPPSSFGSYSLHQSLSSFLFFHLFYPTLHSPAEHVLEIPCPVLPQWLVWGWCHAIKANPSTFSGAVGNEHENCNPWAKNEMRN